MDAGLVTLAGRRLASGRAPGLAAFAALVSFAALVLMPVPGASAAPRGTSPTRAAPSLGRSYRSVCGTAAPDHARCLADLVTAASAPGAAALTNSAPFGYGPVDLQSAYKLTAAAASSGATQTVAIVDAYDDPTAEADVAIYRAQFGLPACTSANGCFRKVDQNGGTSYPPPNAGWEGEIALDTDMVSAICPNCHILLVEADDNLLDNLGTAVDEAATLGATQISNSYGGAEVADETFVDRDYDHPGIAVTASSGDLGWGVEYPAASPYVSAVGGTSLTRDSATARGWDESAWSGAGSGCSAYEPKPAWQTDVGCAHRSVADVSAVADPHTGVAVYSTADGGWVAFGGTSVASPIVASVDALIGSTAGSPQYPYANAGRYFDVSSGSNGSCGSYLCTGGLGYDGPTGIGTPDGASLGPACAADPTITANPAGATVSAPGGASFTAAALNTDPNCQMLSAQWQVSTDAGITFTTIAGTTGLQTLRVASTSMAQSGSRYRAVFTNELGATTSAAATLTVLGPPPSVSTGGASAVTSTTATLNGVVGPNGRSTSYWFQYGTSGAYGAQTPLTSAGSDSSTHAVSAVLSGLPATTYHVRLIATNGYSTQYGGDATFTTLPLPPTRTASPHVTGVAVVGARLTVSTGAWAGTPDAFAYAWLDCPTARGACVRVGSDTASYVTGAADLGGHLYAEVSAHNGGGWSGSVRSDDTVSPHSPVSAGRVRVAGLSAYVPLTGRAGAGAPCTIMLSLTLTGRPTTGRRAVRLGRAVVTLTGGLSRTVTVTLNAAGKRLLARNHRLAATLAVTQSGRLITARALSFTAKRPRPSRAGNGRR